MIALALILFAQQPAAPSTFERLHAAGRVWSVDELRERLRRAHDAGETLQATGKSVFRGTEPEDFPLTIQDLMEGYIHPGHALVFGRLGAHPVIDQAGIIGGMSGSPIYLEGKLVGAIAYSLGSFGKIPFVGITPIEYMLRELDRPEETIGAAIPAESSGPAPVATPISISGAPGRAGRILEEVLRAHGLDESFAVGAAASGSAVFDPPDHLVDGGAIGAQLVGGDWDMTGIGTVTLVDGDRVVAFGHPMLRTGPSDLPMTTAVIHDVFASLSRSNKLGSPGQVVGSLTQDRANSIGGVVGRTAHTVPLRVSVVNTSHGTSREHSFQVLANRMWLPMLYQTVISSTADAYEPYGSDRVAHARTRVRLSGGREVAWEEVSQERGGGGGFIIFLGGRGDPISQILQNEFEPVTIESIVVEQTYVHQNRTAEIHRAWALDPEVAPGGTARIRLQLRPWRAADQILDVPVAIPETAAPGSKVSITLAGGQWIQPDLPPATSLADLLANLSRAYRADALLAVVEVNEYRLLARGRELDCVPASIVAAWAPSLVEPALLARSELRDVRPTDWIIQGRAEVTVSVRRNP